MRGLGTVLVAGAAALAVAGCGASPKAHTLEIAITGDAMITSMTYVVDGRATTLKNLRLPWKKTVRMPPKDGGHTWRMWSKQNDGFAQIIVTVDGTAVTNTSCQGDGCHGSADGAVRD